MSSSHPSDDPRLVGSEPLAELRRLWTQHYGSRVAAQLEPERRYSLLRLGDDEYAFTEYDAFVRALRHVWDSQLVPEQLPSAIGSELLDAAPSLRAVDPEPRELSDS
jgi:hypothetical protein